jgi:hypothetical protein
VFEEVRKLYPDTLPIKRREREREKEREGEGER